MEGELRQLLTLVILQLVFAATCIAVTYWVLYSSGDVYADYHAVFKKQRGSGRRVCLPR